MVFNAGLRAKMIPETVSTVLRSSDGARRRSPGDDRWTPARAPCPHGAKATVLHIGLTPLKRAGERLYAARFRSLPAFAQVSALSASPRLRRVGMTRVPICRRP